MNRKVSRGALVALLSFVAFVVGVASPRLWLTNNPTSHYISNLEEVWQLNAVRSTVVDGALELHYCDVKGNELGSETVTVSSTDSGILGFTASMPDTTKGVLAICKTAGVSIGYCGTNVSTSNYTNGSATAPIALSVGQPIVWGAVPNGWKALVAAYGQASSNVTTSNNSAATLLSSAARTVLTDSADQTNSRVRSVIVYLNITAASGTGGLTLRIEGKDSVSGNYFYLNAAPTAITATGQYAYILGPGCTSSGGSIQQATATVLPLTWRAEVAVGDSSSYTYSISASVIN